MQKLKITLLSLAVLIAILVTLLFATCNHPPTAGNDNFVVDEDTSLNISASGLLSNDADIDGDKLSIDSFTPPSHGTLVDNGDGTFTYTPAPDYNGSDSFTYTVSDGKGGSATVTVTITVSPVNDAPVASDDYYTTDEDTSLTIVVSDLLSNDTDIDGDTLSIISFTQPEHGTLVDNGDGTFTYTPAPDYNGQDSFTYTISDGKGGFATATVTITVNPVNDAPVASDDHYTIVEGATLTIIVSNLLRNDTDIDGGTLTIISFTQPEHGTLVDNGDGTFTYTPAPDFVGQDKFTYTISDGKGGFATATVTINVLPVPVVPVPGIDGDAFATIHAPIACNDNIITWEDTAVSFSVIVNDSDPDGDALSLVNNSAPAHGMVTCALNGICTYTPNANFFGQDSFTYTITDGKGGFATATVTITVLPVNDAPVANDDNYTTNMNTPLIIAANALLNNDTDIDGDTLSIISFTQPSHGTLVDNGDGTFTYTPAPGFFGQDSFTYTISDGKGGFAAATVTITVIITVPSADLELTKTVDNPTFDLGDWVTFTVTVTNKGPDNATNIQILDLVTALLDYTDPDFTLTVTAGTVFNAAGLIVWDLNTLASGDSATLTIVGKAQGSGTNTAEVVAVDQPDPDSTPNNHKPAEDDQASVDITVLIPTP